MKTIRQKRLLSVFLLFFCGMVSNIVTRCQDVPFGDPPEGLSISTNWVEGPIWDVRIKSPGGDPDPGDAMSPETGFLANGTQKFPPDCAGAVGTGDRVMTMLNEEVRIQTRAGTTLLSTTLSNWWSPAGSFTKVFDPKVSFDTTSGRWIATVAFDATLATSSIGLAVSSGSDPTNQWYFQKVTSEGGSTNWADRPMLGFNRSWIAVSVNMYPMDGNPALSFARIFVFDKTNAYNNSFVYWPFSMTPSTGWGLVPAEMNATNLTFLQLYSVLDHSYNGRGHLGYFYFDRVAGTNKPSFTTNLSINQSANPWASQSSIASNRIDAPQQGSNARLDQGDDRFQSVVFRYPYFYAAHTIYLPYNAPTHSAVQVFKLYGNNILQQIVIDDFATNGVFCAYPSIAVNALSEILVGYSSFSSNSYASASYTFKGVNDPNFTRRYNFQPGVDSYVINADSIGRRRWGDYTSTVVDPANDMDFWSLGQYAATSSTNTSNPGRYGVWWAKASVAKPGNDNFINAFQISGAEGTTNGIMYRATSEGSVEPHHAGLTPTRSIWYKWTAPSTNQVSFDTKQTVNDLDTILAVGSSTFSVEWSLRTVEIVG